MSMAQNKGMESLRELYKVGCGPSSSHTMGPEKAARIFKECYPMADRFKVVLYGSLAKTGKGHCTDMVLKKTIAPFSCEIVFDEREMDLPHPNTMDLFAYKEDCLVGEDRVYSIGGGMIRFEGASATAPVLIYPHDSFEEIATYCLEKDIRLWQYAEEFEDEHFWEYMGQIWEVMKSSIRRGLNDDGILPGGLEVHKRAKHLYNLEHIDESAETRENRIVSSYAFAVSEQNAGGGEIVTAPTCGAAGVLPAVLY
ncbi:MAG: L-serine ammonia-lyase, iron-sulfur-dependent, subunit alpha, partial [Firmicutes bacterium]|nr:L-serine ammonia-lyase, iron-sulfur-dependent, subunit alpha [Bacillota bacterium]